MKSWLLEIHINFRQLSYPLRFVNFMQIFKKILQILILQIYHFHPFTVICEKLKVSLKFNILAILFSVRDKT